jgi:hypothetical protein
MFSPAITFIPSLFIPYTSKTWSLLFRVNPILGLISSVTKVVVLVKLEASTLLVSTITCRVTRVEVLPLLSLAV